MEDILAHTNAVWTRQRTNSPIYALLLEDVTINHAEPGLIRATLPVKPLHTNSKGTLHGTLSACVVDWAAGMAITTHGRDSTGVSTDLSVSYMSTAKEGDLLEIEGRVEKIGKTLAFCSVVVWKFVQGGERSFVVKGSHTKYVQVRQ